ncbi:MAG: GNAT family N-acetyltransferase [Candidatus Sericytochromatia bacterium]
MFELTWASEADQTGLQRLLQVAPVVTPTQVMISERQPDYFALLRLQGVAHRVLVARHQGEIQGMLSVCLDQVWLDGVCQRVAYTQELKVSPAARGQGLGDQLMQAGIAACRELAGPDVPIFTCVARDNPVGRAKNQALGRAGVVEMLPLRELETWFFPARLPWIWPLAAGFQARVARPDEQPQLAEFWQRWAPQRQLARVYGPERPWAQALPLATQDWLWLEDRQGVAGMLGLWDQRPWRQIRLPRCPLPLRLLGYRPGEILPLVLGVHLCLRPDAYAGLPVLLKAALAQTRQRGALLLGMAWDTQDPLLRFLPKTTGSASRMQLLGSLRPQTDDPFYMEISLG